MGAVYIGRPSVFGNPFQIGPDGTRDEVIEKFKVYFENRLKEDPEFERAIEALRSCPALICWCAPLLCHGHVIAAYLEEIE